ncbi:hypothetical protein UlMin_036555 [Ulmus minor]
MAQGVLFFILIFHFSITIAQARDTKISLRTSLSPTTNNSYWLSNSGQFAFGFYKQGNGFAVGIWFQNIQQKTVIWTANRDDPPLPDDATLFLTANGLILQTEQGQQVTIATNTSQLVASASMLDSGNFVLYNLNSTIIWQSFDIPTDTLLSTQPLATNKELVSGMSETNHSSGRFRLVMQPDGNLVQYPTNVGSVYLAYWDSKSYTFGNNTTLILDSSGQLYLLSSNGSNVKNVFASPNQTGDKALYRLTIDVDGILRLYSHSLLQNASCLSLWNSTNNKCDPMGLCGLNSYCVLDGQEPHCSCPPDFDFIDQSQRNLGCHRNIAIEGCTTQNGDAVSVEEIDGLTWQDTPYSVISSIDAAACKEECLRDCNCEVALFGNQNCRKQQLPLKFAKTRQSELEKTIIKVRKTTKKSSGGRTEQVSRGRTGQVSTGILISSIVVLAFGLVGLAISGVVIYKYRNREYIRISNQSKERLAEDVIIRPYSYVELEKATNGFTDQVGKGAFGTVFKGVISNRNSAKVVAIKRLEKMVADGEKEFKTEIKVISRTNHRYLVKLLGYCHERDNRLLVYEYMNNGSLADFLFKYDAKPTWEERIGIAFVAKGILYLHEECDTPIIHCDIKPENILMDEQKCAKIADFGLAKLLLPNQTRTVTGFRGTRGYVAPEWHKNMPITVKAGVYSFRIVLLEIICCRRSVDIDVPEDKVVLANWVYDCFLGGEFDQLVEDEEEVDKNDLQRMIKIGLWCIQDDPVIRPTMKRVVLMLEGTIEVSAPPCPTSSISTIQID